LVELENRIYEVSETVFVVSGHDLVGDVFEFWGAGFDRSTDAGPFDHLHVVLEVSDGGDFVLVDVEVAAEFDEGGLFVDALGEEFEVFGLGDGEVVLIFGLGGGEFGSALDVLVGIVDKDHFCCDFVGEIFPPDDVGVDGDAAFVQFKKF